MAKVKRPAGARQVTHRLDRTASGARRGAEAILHGVRAVSVGERRARLGRRHRLRPDARAADVGEAAAAMVGLHATDPATVYLSARSRVTGATPEAVQAALYDERSVVRMLGMRRTLFVVPVDLIGVVEAACTEAIAARERAALVKLIEEAGLAADGGRWLRETGDAALGEVTALGEASTAELAAAVPGLGEQLRLAVGKPYEAAVSVASRLLFVLAAEGHLVRGRPRGSWISTQHRWAPSASWLPGGVDRWSTDEARAELVRRWVEAYGPGTLADLKWWTGLTIGQVKRALSAVGPTEVDLDGTIGFMLAGDAAGGVDVEDPVEPWAALLPSLDSTVMGWKDRHWYLGDRGPALFDTTGNAGPTVWWDGRVVGGWAQRRDGEIAVRLLEDIGEDAGAAVDAEAEEMAAWLGPVRFTPRFPTPVDKELRA
jgi:hypothetical protein